MWWRVLELSVTASLSTPLIENAAELLASTARCSGGALLHSL